MIRSILVILLAIVCGVSAAIGVIQLRSKPAAVTAETQNVYVAAHDIRRGAVIEEGDIKITKWPAELVPTTIAPDRSGIIGRSAVATIVQDEPFLKSKLADTKTGGFVSNVIPKGMRACTIMTKGPSASVAGFVRPGDRVDVLVTLRGSNGDETGGGATLPLLHAVEILAIDDIMDVESATMKMWIKEGLNSVTLLVTPEQALQLSLGQANGTLNLALRNGDDLVTSTAPLVTMNMIRALQVPPTEPTEVTELASSPDPAPTEPSPPLIPPVPEPEPPPRRSAQIRTMRGSQPGQVEVFGVQPHSS